MPQPQHQPLPEKTDVAIVGAGFTGLSAARALAKRGVRTAVLEAQSVGWGASSRNGGMVLPGLKLGVSTLKKRYGLELTQQMYSASLAAIDAVEQIVREEEIDCDFSRCGHVSAASKPKHFESFNRSAEILARDFNRNVKLVSKSELREEIGTETYYGGMVDDVSGGVNPARYVAGLGRAAASAGARIFEHTAVQNVTTAASNGEHRWKVETSAGTLCARDVLIATSGYTNKATRALQKRVIPIGSFIIATEVLTEALARQLIPHNRMIYDSKNYLHYYRLTPDRRMLFGGRAAFFPETHSTIQRSAGILRRDMVAIFPQLREVNVEYAWGGTLDVAFDVMPHAGSLDGMHFAVGYAGHGVAMATYLGKQMGAEICGEKIDNPFARIPFPVAPFGLYNGNPWFLPFAGLWYKLLDIFT